MVWLREIGEFPKGMGEVLRALDWNGMDGKFDIEWVSSMLLFYPFLTGSLLSLDLLFNLL